MLELRSDNKLHFKKFTFLCLHLYRSILQSVNVYTCLYCTMSCMCVNICILIILLIGASGWNDSIATC